MSIDPDAITKRLAEIRERAEKATPGPWVHFANSSRQPDEHFGEWSVDSVAKDSTIAAGPNVQWINPDELSAVISDSCRFKGDADFVAKSRTDIPWLADTIDALLADRAQQAGEAWCAAAMSHGLRAANARLAARLSAEVAKARLAVELAEAVDRHDKAQAEASVYLAGGGVEGDDDKAQAVADAEMRAASVVRQSLAAYRDSLTTPPATPGEVEAK